MGKRLLSPRAAGNDCWRGAIDDPELWRYVRADGRLASMPRRRESGREYYEAEVIGILEDFDADFALLRRYLIDEGLLVRERVRYRRV